MKKIFLLIVIILLLMVMLMGCLEDRWEEEQNNNNDDDLNPKDETSSYEDFIGTWTTLTGAGSFSEGNSIRFNNDDTFEKFWDHGGAALHSGTWELKNLLSENPEIILTQGEMTYNYTYSFYYSHTQLSFGGVIYIKQ